MNQHYRTSRVFDCGPYINEWCICILDHDGRAVEGLLFPTKMEHVAEKVAAALDKAFFMGRAGASVS